MSSESLSTGTLALLDSIQDSGEEVKVIRNVRTVVDTGELQLMQASCCSAQVQTDFEPFWCFQNTPVSLNTQTEDTMVKAAVLDTRSEEMVVKPAVLPMEDSTLIDLRNCDELSIVHLEDMRDPSSQFVMLQAGKAVEVAAAAASSTVYCLPDTESESVTQPQVPVEIVGGPAMFVGGKSRQWKRELELSAEYEALHQPADVDSGIWDMMQALGNVASGSGHGDLSHTSAEQEDVSEAEADTLMSVSVIQPSLQGVYKMFQIADGSGNTESGVSDEQILSQSSYSRAGNGVRQSSVGGLEDALEPVAIVDFVVHRVEAETLCLERVDLADSKTAEGQLQQQGMDRMSRPYGKTENTRNQKKLLVGRTVRAADQNPDYSDGSYEDDESTHRSNEVTPVNVRSDRTAVETYDSATNTPRMKKKHKDVVRVTSGRFGRSLRRRVGSRGRGSWKDPNCEARKSVSADVSRSSSLLDIEGGQQEMIRSSEVYSDPSPEHGESRNVKTANLSAFSSHQPFTSSPYTWRRSVPAGVESHEWFTDGSSSTASGPMSSGLGLFAEPDLLNFEKFPDWMRDLPDALVHVPLSHICIPGKILILLI